MPRNPTNPLLTELRTTVPNLLPKCSRVYTTQYQGNNRHRVKFYMSTKLNVPTAMVIRAKLKQRGWEEVIIKATRNPFGHPQYPTESLQIFATKKG